MVDVTFSGPTLASAVSLLLLVAVCALWAVSYVRCGELRVGTRRPYGVGQVVAGLAPGQLRFGTVREQLAPDDPDPRRHRRLVWRTLVYDADAASGRRIPSFLNRRGFDRIAFVGTGGSLGHTGRTARFAFDTVGVPAWLPALVTALLPALWLRRRRLPRRRAKAGLCPACGYDLRASPDRCPECGAARGIT